MNRYLCAIVLVACVCPMDAAWNFATVASAPLTGIGAGEFSVAQRAIAVSRGGAYQLTGFIDIVGVAFYDPQTSALKYAKLSGGNSWTVETIQDLGSAGRYPSLVLDKTGKAHISYFDDTNDRIRYARELPAGETSFSCGNGMKPWICETIPAESQYSTYKARGRSTIALESDGDVHVAWSATELNSNGYFYTTAYIRRDSGGEYNDPTEVEGSVGSGQQWMTVGGFEPEYLAMRVGSDGKPQLVIRNDTGKLYWLKRTSYSWHGDKIADTVENSTSDRHHAFVLDPSGLPRILFTEADPTQPGLRIARLLSDGTWSYSKPVDQGLGRPCGIVLNSEGYARISYFVSSQLRYAAYYYSAQMPGTTPLRSPSDEERFEEAAAVSPGDFQRQISYSGWSNSVVASGYNLGYRNQIVLRTSDRPLIVYFDAGAGMLRSAIWQ